MQKEPFLEILYSVKPAEPIPLWKTNKNICSCTQETETSNLSEWRENFDARRCVRQKARESSWVWQLQGYTLMIPSPQTFLRGGTWFHVWYWRWVKRERVFWGKQFSVNYKARVRENITIVERPTSVWWQFSNDCSFRNQSKKSSTELIKCISVEAERI